MAQTRPVEPPVSPGEIVAGKYRVEQAIGSGGMGVVVSATHLQLGQRVALKFMRSSPQASDRVLGERFLREARASFRLRSEHAVRVLDVGQLPTGIPFMVMELLEGKDLKDVLLARGPLPEDDAIEYMLQTCMALQEAHAHGIVHRDLKPRNLFLTTRVDGSPCVKVLDFGISKVPKEDTDGDSPLTSPEIALGSPRYMAPEQWKASSAVDARADVYALGMILYELLTGDLPLRDLPLGELLRRMVAGAIPSPREVRPAISENISKVVLKALRPHAEERYQSAQQLAEALRQTRAMATPMRSKVPSSAPLSSTAATAVIPIPQQQQQVSQAVPTPQDRPEPSRFAPPTRREVPARATSAPLEEPVRPTLDGPYDVAEEPSTLVSSQEQGRAVKARAHQAATLQSSVVPPEVEAALARARSHQPKVEFDDKTTVDPPRAQPTAPEPPPPISYPPGVSPAAQSVQGQQQQQQQPLGPVPFSESRPEAVPQMMQMTTTPMANPPYAGTPPPVQAVQAVQPVPMAPSSQPQIVPIVGVHTTSVASPRRGMPTWLWIVIVLVVGFAVGGGLALAFALKGV